MSSSTSSASFITILDAKSDQFAIEQRIARRRNLFDPHEIAGVAGIFDQVRALGDEAVLAATRVHDGGSLETCRVSDREAEQAAASARDMQRTATFARLNHGALVQLQPAIMELALYEGLPCHAGAADIRGKPARE